MTNQSRSISDSPVLPYQSLRIPHPDYPSRPFLLTTSRKQLDLTAINDAFDSEELYWTQRMDEKDLVEMLERSWCWGLFEVLKSNDGSYPSRDDLKKGESTGIELRQVGLIRLITDYKTFTYATDFYVLPDYRSQGLASWLLRNLDAVMKSWPLGRRFMLLTDNDRGRKFYEKAIGMAEFEPGHVVAMCKKYAGAKV